MHRSCSKKNIQALGKANFDLFFSNLERTHLLYQIADDRNKPEKDKGKLLRIEELYNLFNDFNARYFEGLLPPVKIAYSERMLIAGSYSISEKIIRIGKRYHEIFPDEIEDTLKHEMIHILDSSHGRNFKSIAKKIGASLKARAHPDLRLPAKYFYECPVCGRVYRRRKKLIMASCGSCSRGGKFDADCKLKLLKGGNLLKKDSELETI